MLKKSLLVLSMFLGLLLLVACGNSSSNSKEGNSEKKDIRIACNSVSEASLKAAKASMKKAGYNPEFVVFSNNIEALQAVQDGNCDASFAQHEPFMKSFNKQKGGDLSMMKPHVYYTGIGLYSNKYDNIDDLPDGAQIAIMNDAMNRDNSLLMMQDAGLIKLTDSKKSGFTTIDIVENPKNFNFVEIEQAQTVRSLEDLDAATCFFTFMFNSGKDYEDYLIRDQHAKDFPISLIVKTENKNSDWAKSINDSFTTKESKKGINGHFKGVFTFYE
ncbi:MetQ/NlpA family ABC transporter substrate-binding protein [Enterococcus alishanensis]|uniref:MetQ/NlpA family ABC transporter substrate-binding protein n=1 Tax=Enterococcus alishanensis TaxID=1303817 RepID=UPI001FED066C|nr:MetQ/NlpA family ABC transporter substrate-binding protein [Enterococcus alishanensis]